MRPVVIIAYLVIAGLSTACGSDPEMSVGSTVTSLPVSTSTAAPMSVEATIAPPSTTTSTVTITQEYALPVCDFDLPTAPEDWYRGTPQYVGNEQPIRRVSEWAKEHHQGWETVWIDREHNGWLVLGFTSGDIEAIQAEIEAQFPNDGIVAVELPYTRKELNAIDQRLREELADQENMYSSGADLEQGRVSVWVGPMTEERISTVVEAAAGDPVCIEGIPPDELPEPGPQPTTGDGWRLLDERDGGSFQARIATNPDQYRTLWRDSVLTGEPPEVDFETEVVLWLPYVYSSSCPKIRLDAVVVDTEQGLLYPVVVTLSQDQGCTADANPHQYVVAVERSTLPSGPFIAGLGVDLPEMHPDAVRIDADLTVPGSTTRGLPVPRTLPPPEATPMPLIVEPGFPYPVTLGVSCGIGVIGEINDYLWATEEEEIPEEWEIVGDDLVDVEVLLQPGDSPSLIVTSNGASVTYHITRRGKGGL